MTVRVIPVELHTTIHKSEIDAGGTTSYPYRLPDDMIAEDLEHQLNNKENVPPGAQLVGMIKSSKQSDKYLAIYNIP